MNGSLYLLLLVAVATLSHVGALSKGTSLDGDTAVHFDRFSEWLEKKGGETEGLVIARSLVSIKANKAEPKVVDRGFGVFAGRSFHEGEQILRIPRSIMMASGEANQRMHRMLMKILDEHPQTPTHEQMMQLLFERAQGDKGSWSPYIDILPTTFNTTAYFSDAEMEQLQASPVRSFATRRNENLEMQYDRVIGPLMSVLDPSDYTMEGFKWAASIIWSRAFSIPALSTSDRTSIGALVPMLDLFNAPPVGHGGPPMVRVVRDNDASLRYVANMDIPEGTEIEVRYGALNKPMPNGLLLMDYGYIQEDNPDDQISIYIPTPPRLQESETLSSIMQSIGLSWLHDSIPMERGLIGLAPLLAKVRLLTMSAEELKEMPPSAEGRRELLRVPHAEGGVLFPFSLRNDKAATRELISILTRHYQAYGTTIKEDLRSLRELDDANSPVSLAIRLRVAEKELLLRGVRHLKQYQTALQNAVP
eukprot:TRINITY_DN16911_c0_g1_i1.p1 TRINITY_DN16911_c0_g1~~TRINITY_DN16911_c0_g1_i1.p1  ORF type:complete len:476 (+),score=59.73 TRINITY_DN16911_c0_g1_i1:178-1605(+)